MCTFRTKDNNIISYTDQGHGKPLIFIHGWGCDSRYFSDQVEKLKNDYRIITYDLRGHGNSKNIASGFTMAQLSQDLQSLIQYLNLKKVNLIGWSLGVLVICEYIKQFGCSNIDRICFEEMTPKLINEDGWELGFSNHYYNLMALSSMCSDWPEFCRNFFYGMFVKGSKVPDTMGWALQKLIESNPLPLINMWIDMSLQDYRNVLLTINIPCLLLYGKQSLLNKNVGTYMHGQIKDSKLVYFDNASHALHLEKSDDFYNELIRFFI